MSNKKLLSSESSNPLIKSGLSASLSEGLRYHIKNSADLTDPVYRPGTREFFNLFCEARDLYFLNLFEATDDEADVLESDIGEWGIYEGQRVPLDFPMWDEDLNESPNLDEAKYKGREVKLGKAGASRSGGRAHVYVRNPKTGKIKKVSFGSSAPDAMGDSPAHKKRRKSFASRHRCAQNKDKMSASYWACRATKMFGRKVPGWW